MAYRSVCQWWGAASTMSPRFGWPRRTNSSWAGGPPVGRGRRSEYWSAAAQVELHPCLVPGLRGRSAPPVGERVHDAQPQQVVVVLREVVAGGRRTVVQHRDVQGVALDGHLDGHARLALVQSARDELVDAPDDVIVELLVALRRTQRPGHRPSDPAAGTSRALPVPG